MRLEDSLNFAHMVLHTLRAPRSAYNVNKLSQCISRFGISNRDLTANHLAVSPDLIKGLPEGVTVNFVPEGHFTGWVDGNTCCEIHLHILGEGGIYFADKLSKISERRFKGYQVYHPKEETRFCTFCLQGTLLEVRVPCK